MSCMHAKSLQSCLTLFKPMDCRPPGSSVHGTLQARILEWVVISSSRDLLNPGIEPVSLLSPILAGGFFTTSATCMDFHVLETFLYLPPPLPAPRGMFKTVPRCHKLCSQISHIWENPRAQWISLPLRKLPS